MTAWAVVWLIAFTAMAGGLATPPHVVNGKFGLLVFVAQFVAGFVLAIHAL